MQKLNAVILSNETPGTISIGLNSLGNKEDIYYAVSSAKKAYNSWAFSTKEERINLLEKLYVIYNYLLENLKMYYL